ncbi:glycosyltransferase [Microbacterium sp. NPDC055903]
MLISVVIPYGGGDSNMLCEQVGAVAASARASHGAGATVEVVISCNREDVVAPTRMALSERDHHIPLRIIDSSRFPGPSFARNAGAAASSGALVLFCDADDVVDYQWIPRMTRALQSAPVAIGLLDFAELNAPSDFWWRQRATPGPGTKFSHLPFGVSANIGFERQLFEALGGFDVELTVGEDVDICWRAQYMGAELIYVNEAKVHYRLRRRPMDQLRQAYDYGKGDAMLMRRHRPHGAERSVGEGVRAIAATAVLSAASLFVPRYRSKARYRAGHLAGRVVGSVRCRTWVV